MWGVTKCGCASQLASATRTTSKAGTDPPGGHTLYSQRLKQGHSKCLGMLYPHSQTTEATA